MHPTTKLILFWLVVAPFVFLLTGHTVIESILWGTASVLTGFVMFLILYPHE